MITYLEIKSFIAELFASNQSVDEDSDIILKVNDSDEKPIILRNNVLLDAFNKYIERSVDGMCLLSDSSREVAVRSSSRLLFRRIQTIESITDGINHIEYSISNASPEYCVFLLMKMIEFKQNNRKYQFGSLNFRLRNIIQHGGLYETTDTFGLISKLLRVYTLTVSTDKQNKKKDLSPYALSFEFNYMYKMSIDISEFRDIQDMFSDTDSMPVFPRDKMDSPPNRFYNAEVIDYYTLAMESSDPFIIYISFYHIIEYYFEAAFQRNISIKLREKITSPDFSYKNDAKIYELAKYIQKHMRIDMETGKGNEFDSLQFVLKEYVSIDDLKGRIDHIDPDALLFYQNNVVPFTTSNKTKIAWGNLEGVYKNIATRIYETRNALVHSKSDRIQDQYRPYSNRNDLIKEIALIRAVAELILINSSEIM